MRAVPDRTLATVKRFLVVAGAVFALAGCGGSGGNGLYSYDHTRACLEKKPFLKVDNKVDFVAGTATAGAFRVHFTYNQATVSFGKTVADANNINAAYHRFHAKNVGVDDILYQDKNIVALYKVHPLEGDVIDLTHCYLP